MILMGGTGSELQLVYEASKILEDKGIGVRVVSMPSWELFEKQSPEYKESVLPSSINKRLAVEAGSALGWHRYVGMNGTIISMESFGASGPANELFEKFGFTVDSVVEKALELV